MAPGAPADPAGGPYHAGERAVQARARVGDMAARVGRSIHVEIPPAAAAFVAAQRLVFLSAADPAGRVWASALTGPLGFARALDPRTLRVTAPSTDADPLHELLQAAPMAASHHGAAFGAAGEGPFVRGPFVGLLAIDFAARRRMRLNGRLARAADGALLVRADQVFANCPKYIQARQVVVGTDAPAAQEAAHGPGEGAARWGATLTDAQRALIRNADTFVIATRHPDVGADCSHRGGLPGFVRVERCDGGAGRAVDRLTWPDYPGNAMFNTLGNLAVDPRAGLLCVDFARGTTLQLTGRAATDWDPAHAASVPGAERLVTFDVEAVVEGGAALPFRLASPEYSPFNPPAD